MNELEFKFIDDYFQQKLSENERIDFEKRISTDKQFAELVAFYTSSKAVLRNNKLAEKHAEWNKKPKAKTTNFYPKIWLGLAASLFLFIGVWFFNIQNEPQEYTAFAQNYIKNELATLPLKMDATADSLELGKNYYNQKNYEAARKIFEKFPTPEAIEYRGLIALQTGDYKTAENYFRRLSIFPDLIVNNGKFYLGLTLAQKGDKEGAEAIFNEIKAKNLAGKKIIEGWKK